MIKEIYGGLAKDSTGKYDISFMGKYIIDSSVIGAGGLDTGTYIPNNSYNVFVIDDSTHVNQPNLIFSDASNSSPALPTGYDIFRLIDVFVSSDEDEEKVQDLYFASGVVQDDNTKVEAVRVALGEPAIAIKPTQLEV